VISISVVIPAFNRAALIREALSSVDSQTRAPLETIVIDDASTDETAEIAERAGARVIRMLENRGAAAARNEGIRAASGEAIALLDSDDRWDPHHLATVATLLEENPGAAAAGSAIRLTGARSGIWKGRIPEGPPAVVVREAFKDWLTPTSTTMVRRDALLAIGGYDESERYSEDFDLWLRLARRFRFVASREVTADWRTHRNQVSVDQERQWFALYKFRSRAITEIRREGDLSLADELSEIFRVRWANDVQVAWDKGRTGWLKQLVRLAPLVPDLPAAERFRWELRSRIPQDARPFFRAALRIARSSLHVASGGIEHRSSPSRPSSRTSDHTRGNEHGTGTRM
jgi:glycosyltransferase involved in cell wall biosynthesis